MIREKASGTILLNTCYFTEWLYFGDFIPFHWAVVELCQFSPISLTPKFRERDLLHMALFSAGTPPAPTSSDKIFLHFLNNEYFGVLIQTDVALSQSMACSVYIPFVKWYYLQHSPRRPVIPVYT